MPVSLDDQHACDMAIGQFARQAIYEEENTAKLTIEFDGRGVG